MTGGEGATATRSQGAQDFLPRRGGLPSLRSAAGGCRGCALYRDATATVFGSGPASARFFLVGEVPGDQEDRQGEPFVGPAGRLLGHAMADAGMDRKMAYLTNAVKHFRFTRDEGGKRRIHKKPSRGQIAACRPWLLAELAAVRPEIIVCLGATAAQSLLGNDFRVTRERGVLLGPQDLPEHNAMAERPEAAPRVLATVHPSAILRAKGEDRTDAYDEFVSDLRAAASESTDPT
ncbi:uracil-DNA glycosylase [Prauserella marina]|uniref:Type-4 uracil-DNA glycosylase n=1 Tax=Prauserella marina TaxID=530584 RepID=A0A222VMN4_9PSEU|nr:UdgX family uracil-DNA binding protein [Prauserella marina]ASR35112.1 uracil-DNA glycosylase [Prauserella marina]PWV85133.1 DNA polymerase [Prauserella marina]SDC04023.1 DNA polymerase [Prauserella marina]